MKNNNFDILDLSIWFILIASIAGALVVRYASLTTESFWFDEAVTFQISGKHLGEIFGAILAKDSQPPLFVLLSKLWMMITGRSDLSARLLCSIIGFFSVIYMFSMVRSFAGKRAATIAAVITAFHHFILYYSLEFRSYILLFALSSVYFRFFKRFIERGSNGDLAIVFAANVLLLYTHYYSFLIILFINLLFITLPKPNDSNRIIAKWWWAQSASILIFSLWLPGFAYHAFHVEQTHVSLHVNLLNMLYFLTPNTGTYVVPYAAMYDVKQNPFIIKALPYLVLTVFSLFIILTLSRLRCLIRVSSIDRIKGLLSSEKFKPVPILLCYMASLAVMHASKPLFKTGIPGDFNFSLQFREASLILTVIFALILAGFVVSTLVRQLIDIRKEGKINAGWVISAFFPLFALVCVEISGMIARPSFQEKNLIIILPSYIAGFCIILSLLKKKYFTLTSALIFLLMIISLNHAQRFNAKFGYDEIALFIESRSKEIKTPLPVIVLSRESKACMEHYLKENTIIDCSENCPKISLNHEYAAWVWHDIGHAKEARLMTLLRSNMKVGHVVKIVESKKLKAALIKY